MKELGSFGVLDNDRYLAGEWGGRKMGREF